MTVIEKIKAEIERLKKAQEVSEDKDYAQYELDVACGYDMACDDILSFLSTLESEKPMNQEGLEEEVHNYLQIHHLHIKDGGRVVFDNDDSPNFMCDVREIARHFAKWGAENLKK